LLRRSVPRNDNPFVIASAAKQSPGRNSGVTTVRVVVKRTAAVFAAITWSAVVFAVLVGCAPSPKPPFDLAQLTPEKVLDVVEWLGSLDLSQPDPVMTGLRLNPEFQRRTANLNGHEVPNIVQVYFGPMLNGSKTTLDYAIYDPQGKAAHERDGGITRAVLQWRLRPQGDFHSFETCVRVKDLRDRFGSPVDQFIITDGGGLGFRFRVSSVGGWRTYTSGYEDPDGCIDTLPIRQTDR
jgi:hypothetical protein